ncbi:tektin-4 isoform X2 [Thunnus maccoyii]|uniref:tektin-4 isoform X2 n=1 Tax=Thunnus maccoyii TaxID=8240 RepID=UPI001C4CACD9|nr:tektin-4 isoform X2 [Thunnus maccoyii]
MSWEVLVSRPHFDSRAVAQGVPEKEPPVEPEVPQPSSGSATAGYRSAKYTPAEWFSKYHSILQQAGSDQHEARRIQRGSKTLYQDTETATLRTQAEGTCHLGERLQEIHHWRSELQRHIEQLLADTESLLALKTRLEKALDATETPYAIATDNLNCRTRRLGPDLVRDTVEEELLKEVDLIRSIQALLKRTTTQVVSQIKMNREAKQMLEMDWSDKYQAYNFDDLSGRYTNMSPDTRHHPSSATVQDQWSPSQGNFRNAVLVHSEDMSEPLEPPVFNFQHHIATPLVLLPCLFASITLKAILAGVIPPAGPTKPGCVTTRHGQSLRRTTCLRPCRRNMPLTVSDCWWNKCCWTPLTI